MTTIKTAIIGYGYMGQIRHQAIAKNPSLELTMVCEVNPETIQEGNYPFLLVRDIERVFSSNVDLVFVCTPNDRTASLVVELLHCGKHVFCEKPPGRCLQDIKEIREAEKCSPRCKLMFGFNHRYHPGIQRAKQLIARGNLGEILWLRGLYGKSGGRYFRESWRNDKTISGGGILLDQGIHMLDLFRYFCGDFEEVKCFASNRYWKFDLEDNAFVILKNKRGQNAMLHSSATFWKHRFHLEIGLEKGYMIVEGLLSKTGSYGRETLIVGRQQFEDEADAIGNPSEEITYFDKDLSWEVEVDKMVTAIRNDLPVQESTSWEALKVMEIVETAYRDGQVHRFSMRED